MSKRLFSIIPPPIHITNNAWEKLNNICNKLSINNFIFSAIGGGCGGYNYNLTTLTNEEYNKLMTTHTTKTSLTPTIITKCDKNILIDPVSEFLLLGTTIDYVNEDYENNIYENKFIFIPDKTKSMSCGCGISFSPV